MKQLIDKSALVAEIERLKTLYNDDENIHHVAKYNILVDIHHFLDTLEVKDMGLEEAINGLTFGWIEGEEYGELQNTNKARCVTLEEVKEAMRCIYELGLKTQKGWSQKDAIVIEGVCSDKDFIDTNHGILAFGAEEGSYRPFNDGDKVKIIITKGE